MRKRRFWSASLALALATIFGACQRSAPPTIPTTPTGSPTAPPVSTATPTPTQAPPTPSPLPTWPERWEQTGGPDGGLVEAVAVDPADPSTLYAAGAGGAIYKSSDGGETWLPGERLVPSSCPFTNLAIDAGENGTVYAANPCAGVFTSSDAGASWTHASTGIDAGVTLLTQSPHAPGLLLAADNTGQVYRSQDRAVTWEPISDGLPGEPIRGLAASAPDTYWATTANGHDGTVYRFSNGFWSPVIFGQPPGTDATNVLVDFEDPATIYVGLEAVQNADPSPDIVHLFRSTDGAFNWSPLASLPGDIDAQANPHVYLLGQGGRSGVLFIARSGGLLSSPDRGDTWEPVELPHNIFATVDLRQVAVDPTNNNVLYLPLRSTGIAKSEDGGRTWRTINRGLNNVVVSHIAAHPTDPATLYAVPVAGPSIFKSTDYGDNWTPLSSDDLDRLGARRADDLVVDPHRPDTLYQVLDVGRVFRSDDGGATWLVAWPEFRFSSIYSLAAAPSDPTVLYANKSGFGLFRSDDNGSSWRFLSGSGANYTYALAVHPDNPDLVLSGDNRKPSETSAQLHRSRDRGVTWDVALEVPDAVGITSVAFDPRVEPYFARGRQPADPTRLYAASAGPRGALWFSNDAGDSWQPLNDDLNFTNIHVLTAAPHRPDVAYAGLWGGGTWRTDDGGGSWHRLLGDPATSAAAIAVDPTNHNIIYIADATTPHLYRSTDEGNHWELLYDAGVDYDQLVALALAPSDPTLLYVSATSSTGGAEAGAILRVNVNAPVGENANDITGDLPGTPSSLAVHRLDPQRIFAAINGAGVWKTMDGGLSWRQVKSGLPETSFFQIVVDPILPQTLFLAGGHDLRPEDSEQTDPNPDEMHGVWKSTDDGNTWVKVGGATFGRVSGPIRAIAFHPDDHRVMYAAGEGGIYLSPDRGDTWTNITGRLPFVPMNAVAADGQTLYAGSAGAGVFPGAIHPLIHTADWSTQSHLAVRVDHIQIVLHPDDPQTLYASAYPSGVFKTIDGGSTWSARNLGLPSFAVADPSRQGHYALAIAPSAPEVLYLGSYGEGVYRSGDGAVTWRPVFGQEGQLQHANVQALLVHPNDPAVVYVATEQGVWRTADGGRGWDEFSAGLPPGGDIRTLVLGNDGQLYAGSRGYGLYARNATQETVDDAWRQLPEIASSGTPWPLWDNRPLYQSTSLVVHPHDPYTLYAATFPAGVFKTIDGGATWRELNVGFENDGALFLISRPDDDRILFAGTANGIVRSIDGGAIWHPRDAGWPPQQWVLSIAFDPTNPDVLYACSRDGQDLEEAAGTVMKSTDGGATWFEITTGLDPILAFSEILVDRFDSNIVYLATEQDGVYISRDGGASWSSWNEGLWNRTAGNRDEVTASVLRFSADGRLLYFGTDGSGVWRRPAEGAP